MTYRGLFIADIHIGAMKFKDTYEGIMHIRNLLEELTREEPLDYIIIGGDLFDKQLYANDPYIGLSQKLMIYFLGLAKKVRVVYGTSSHESDQYGIFDTIVDDIEELSEDIEFDFKVITTVSEEELYPDMHVLYVPEEYIFDKEEYYKDFLNEDKEYDYIFGHGVINEAFPYIKSNNAKDRLRKKAPTFTAEELADCCRGDVIFGHYHIHDEYLDGKVSYVGSYFRWMFGQEEDKGCYLLTYDTEEKEFRKTFLINEKAFTYVSISYGYKDKLFTDSDSMESEAKKILKKKKKYNIDFLRVTFNIPVGYENADVLMGFFKARFKEEKNIKLLFVNGYVEEEKRLAKLNLKEMDADRRVILDKNIDGEDKIQYFLKVRKGVEMPLEKIRLYLDIPTK